MSLRFSIVMIAKNEAKTLKRLVDSLQEFMARGGETVLLDTGSTDGTPALARNLGITRVEEVGERFITKIDEETAKQINKRFVKKNEAPVVSTDQKLFNFAAARNYSASLASNDMIATMDCDEAYTKFNIDALEELIASGAEQFLYNFVFSHDQFGNEAIKFNQSKFYNRKKAFWTGIVHEVLSSSVQPVFVGEDIIKLEHWQKPGGDHRSRYITGLALDCFENPENDRNSHYFAREMLWTGRPYSAIAEFERHIKMNKWLQERAQSMIFVGDAYEMLGKEDEQIESYQKAFTTDGSRRGPLMRLANLYRNKEDFQRAGCYAAAAMEIAANGFYADDLIEYRDGPHDILAWSNYWLGNKDASKLHFDRALSLSPLNTKYLYNYRNFYSLPKISIIAPVIGRPGGTQLLLDSIRKLNYPAELIETCLLTDEPRIGVPRRLKEGVEKTNGEWIIYAANDMEFTPDSVMIAYLDALKHNCRLVAFNCGPLSHDLGNICEHFLIKRSLISEIGGDIFDVEFDHVGVDNLLWAKCAKIFTAKYCAEAIIKHHHFSRGRPIDEVDNIAAIHNEKDRVLLVKKLEELNAAWPLAGRRHDT